MPTLKQNQFYCVCCGNQGRKSVVTLKPSDIVFVRLHNKKRTGGVPALKGTCKGCGCKLIKFISDSKAESALKKYGR